MNVSADKVRESIRACLECYTVCLQTIQHSLKTGGEHASPESINILRDCAGICELAARYMIGRSEFAVILCDLCAEVCDRCAEACESLPKTGEQMDRCAETCRSCAQICREMA